MSGHFPSMGSHNRHYRYRISPVEVGQKPETRGRSFPVVAAMATGIVGAKSSFQRSAELVRNYLGLWRRQPGEKPIWYCWTVFHPPPMRLRFQARLSELGQSCKRDFDPRCERLPVRTSRGGGSRLLSPWTTCRNRPVSRWESSPSLSQRCPNGLTRVPDDGSGPVG